MGESPLSRGWPSDHGVNDQLKPKREDLTSGKEALTSAYVQVRAFSR